MDKTQDPTQLPVQFNLKIPWEFKRWIERKAVRERISQNQLGVNALMAQYGKEFERDRKNK